MRSGLQGSLFKPERGFCTFTLSTHWLYISCWLPVSHHAAVRVVYRKAEGWEFSRWLSSTFISYVNRILESKLYDPYQFSLRYWSFSLQAHFPLYHVLQLKTCSAAKCRKYSCAGWRWEYPTQQSAISIQWFCLSVCLSVACISQESSY